MKVYIVKTKDNYEDQIYFGVFAQKEDAGNMLKSFKGSKDIFIEEHEVIE